MSYARTATWLAGLSAFFVGAGFAIAGEGGLVLGLAMALLLNIVAYRRAGDAMFARFNIREVDSVSSPWFVEQMRRLAERAALPPPRSFVFKSEQPNAFATGRGARDASIAVTDGLLRRMSARQITGVLAHELGHIRNRDNLVLTVTATIAGGLFGRGRGRCARRGGGAADRHRRRRCRTHARLSRGGPRADGDQPRPRI